jgi:hypothetical protein
MHVSRRWLSLALLVLFAGAWSLAMGVLGLWFILGSHAGKLASPWVSVSAGLMALCAAQLVFLICVVDRFFPMPHFWIRGSIQSGNMMILVSSTLVLIPSAIIAGT